VSQRQTSFAHHFDQVAQAELVAQVPANTQNDDLPIEMASTEQLLQSLQLAHRGSSVRFAPTTLIDSPPLFAPEPDGPTMARRSAA
jgi:hypothetical protein